MSSHNSLSSFQPGELGVSLGVEAYAFPEQGAIVDEFTPGYIETVYQTGIEPRPIYKEAYNLTPIEQSTTESRVEWSPESFELLYIADAIQKARDQHPLLIRELDVSSEPSFIRSILTKLINFDQR